MKDLLTYIGGATVVLSLAVGLAYALFQALATKWMESRFSFHLEAFRHEQAKEFEHFRFRISSELDRLTKLRHQEFEALPQLWALTNKAYGAASVIASGFNLHSDLNQIFDDDFFGIVDSSLLPDWQKKNLKSADRDDRNEIYRRYSSDQALSNAISNSRDLHMFATANMIFIDLSISEKVETVAKMIAEVLLSEQLAGAERRRLNEDSPYEALLGKGQVLLTELGNLIHSRLWTPQDVIPSDQSGPG